MRRMRLGILVVGIAMVGMAPTLIAQEAGPGRYELRPSEDGFIRLDTETGAISHCSKRDGVWYCDVLAEDRTALRALSDDVAALRGKVASLELRLNGLVTPPPQAAEPPGDTPDLSFGQAVMQRFFAMVREMKRGNG